jgi:predicted RNA binding protein YcfA (HicA-like mRNA interferase family)
MPKLPVLRAREIIRIFLSIDFYIHHQTGSHVHLRHYKKFHLRITIPRHDKFDIPPFVLNNILKQAGMTKEEFLKLLKK